MGTQPTLPRRPMLHDDGAKDAFEESTKFSLSTKAIIAFCAIGLAVFAFLLILSL